MDRFTALAAAFVLTGCATTSQSAPRDEYSVPASIIRTGDGYYVTLPSSGQSSVHTVAAPAEQTWSALTGAYGELGIPIRTLDTDRRLLGNQQFEFQDRFAGERMSEYFDCGTGTLGLANADSYRIRASLLTWLEPVSDDRTKLRMSIEAVGSSTEGSSQARAECRSTGALEQRIADLVATSVGGAT